MQYSPRSVRYESDCNSVLDRIIQNHGDDAIIALEWSLARKPGEWLSIPGTDVFMARTRNPTIRMYFKFDDQFVTILAIDTE